MKSEKSHFKFKGTRDYVHGTDIYNYILEKLLMINKDIKSFSKFNLSFLRQTMTNIDFYSGTKEEFQNFANKEAITFRGSVLEKNEAIMFWGVENNEPIDGRYEYNEKKIEDSCIAEANRISFDSKLSDLSFIENIIPMNKKLLAVSCPQFKGKWMFTRLDLDSPIPQQISEELTLEIYQASNPKLVCSNILRGQDKAGRIFFSLT